LSKFEVFSKKLPSKLPVPSPHPVGVLGAAPTDEARELFEEHASKADAEMARLMGMVNHGVKFSANRLRRQARHPGQSHQMLEGMRFDEDDTEWEVLKVQYDKNFRQLLVYYFDVKMAREQGYSRAMMIDNCDNNINCDPLETSSLKEVND
jgi:hypothetical protein